MLKVDIDGPVARITLDRPEKRNALAPELLRRLIAACDGLRGDRAVRAVVLAATGEAFSAGADLIGFLAELQGPDARENADLGRRAAEALASLPQPTVAVVHGACVGGGVVLVSACDIAIATSTARFRVPEVELGIPLAWGGTTRLVQAFGPRVTADLVLSCRWFDAREARELGLVSRLVDEEALDAVVAELVGALVQRPRLAVEVTKRQIRRALAGDPDDPGDADALLAALRDAESMEAAQAYFATQLSGR
ncbi:MAG: enoyl-CoA hydratase/isomerase family protein [Alphaproteobacteria bacterium]|nr:enoyl-CoA hydratase/isomerase family protein [Alphaproteobacteria bacterium]